MPDECSSNIALEHGRLPFPTGAISGVAESSGIRAYRSGCRELRVCGGRQRRRMQSTVSKDAEARPNLKTAALGFSRCHVGEDGRLGRFSVEG
jgi:hypothetical protein